MTILRLFAALGTAGLLISPFSVHATAVTYDLTFETAGQSIWDTGDAYVLDQTTFLGTAWKDKNIKAGTIVAQGQTAPNPLRVTYDGLFATCRALGNSSSTCINGQSARTPVPALGSRPSVRSCGRFAVACKIARAGDLSRRAAYDVAYATCRKGFSSSVCRNGQSGRLPVVALGTAPPARIDLATGVEVKGSTDGRAGLEFGIEIDSGSVDAQVSYKAVLDIPDTTSLAPGATINFNPNSLLAGTNQLDTSFSSMKLNLDAVMQLSGDVSAEACLVAVGCSSGGTPFDIDERASILSFNQDGEGGVKLLGLQPSTFGFPDQANGFPFEMDVAGLASIALHLPQPNASGGLDTGSDTLKASAQDDLLDVSFDLDNIIATSAGVPGLFGTSASVAGVSLGYDIIDVQMGPSIDLKQNFELDPTLWVNLQFDELVEIGGMLVDEWDSAWDLLPDIRFLADDTMVTPTFFLEADLLNETLLDFDLNLTIDLLQITYGFDQWSGSLGIGNVLDQGADLFESPNLYSELFELQGWDLQIGEGFLISLGSQSILPSSSAAQSAVNPIVLPALNGSVPLPGTLLLLLSGVTGMISLRHRGRRA